MPKYFYSFRLLSAPQIMRCSPLLFARSQILMFNLYLFDQEIVYEVPEVITFVLILFKVKLLFSNPKVCL